MKNKQPYCQGRIVVTPRGLVVGIMLCHRSLNLAIETGTICVSIIFY